MGAGGEQAPRTGGEVAGGWTLTDRPLSVTPAGVTWGQGEGLGQGAGPGRLVWP